jgi:ABC-type multidrug transport system ATPase subunit
VAVGGHPAHSREARRLAGYASSTPVFPPGLTVRSVLTYYAQFHGPAAAGPADVAAALELAQLGEWADRRPAGLPYAVLRRVGLAQAALGGRRVLLLDETLDGLDPALRRAVSERLGRLAWHGGAVVVATQELAVVERLADRVLVLHAGRVVRDAPAAAVLRDRVLEIVLDAPPAHVPEGFRPAPFGVEADLRGRTVEAALAQCRVHRWVVRGTRVRVKALEDIVVESGRGP